MYRCFIQCIVLSVCFMQFQIHASSADDFEFNMVLPKLLREKPHVVQHASIDDLLQKNLSRSLLDKPVEISVAYHRTVTVGDLVVDDVSVIQRESAEKRNMFFSMVAWCSNCCSK
jgi:hypothetical protein